MDELTDDILEEADGLLVRVERDGYSPPLDGYLLAHGDDFVLLHRIDDRIRLDGYVLVRRETVSRLVSPHDNVDFLDTVLERRGLFPGIPAEIEVDEDLEAVVESAGEYFELLSFHPEKEDPESCTVGDVLDVDEDAWRVRTVDSGGVWIQEQEIDPESITRVDFGGDYEDALAIATDLLDDDDDDEDDDRG